MASRVKGLQTNREAQIYKVYVNREETCARTWTHKWGWYLNEHKILKKKLLELGDPNVVENKTGTDTRTILPIPNSVNHEYGWISSRPEFNLQLFGADVPKFPIPQM